MQAKLKQRMIDEQEQQVMQGSRLGVQAPVVKTGPNVLGPL
jgi:hypothetical protein